MALLSSLPLRLCFLVLCTIFSGRVNKCYNKYMFKNYLEYLRDNPNHYWFKRKLYGWGWTPATWQGWLSTAVFVVVTIAIVLFAAPNDSHLSVLQVLVREILPIVVLAGIFVIFISKTGEPPAWQWGKPKKKDGQE